MLDLLGRYSAEEAREALRREYGHARDGEPEQTPDEEAADDRAVES